MYELWEFLSVDFKLGKEHMVSDNTEDMFLMSLIFWFKSFVSGLVFLSGWIGDFVFILGIQ